MLRNEESLSELLYSRNSGDSKVNASDDFNLVLGLYDLFFFQCYFSANFKICAIICSHENIGDRG